MTYIERRPRFESWLDLNFYFFENYNSANNTFSNCIQVFHQKKGTSACRNLEVVSGECWFPLTLLLGDWISLELQQWFSLIFQWTQLTTSIEQGGQPGLGAQVKVSTGVSRKDFPTVINICTIFCSFGFCLFCFFDQSNWYSYAWQKWQFILQ